MTKEIYLPAEDSYLLAETIKNYLKDNKFNKNQIEKLTALDLGTGSAFQSKNLILHGLKKENILALDINQKALKEAKKLGVKIILSDLFNEIPKIKKFNIILFNPPYLPENIFDKNLDTSGGKFGDEVIIEFIKQLPDYLEKEGKAFFISSSLAKDRWKKEAEKQGLKIEKAGEKRIFFEELYCWKLGF